MDQQQQAVVAWGTGAADETVAVLLDVLLDSFADEADECEDDTSCTSSSTCDAVAVPVGGAPTEPRGRDDEKHKKKDSKKKITRNAKPFVVLIVNWIEVSSYFFCKMTCLFTVKLEVVVIGALNYPSHVTFIFQRNIVLWLE